MTENLNKLIDYRDAILLAEIGALIHDLGKLSEEFIKSKCIEESENWIHHTAIIEYDIYKGISISKKAKQILENFQIKLKKNIINLYDFIRGHHKKQWDKSEKWDKPENFSYNYPKYVENNIFLKFIIASDTFDSEEDKSQSRDPQSCCGVYKSTTFGFENEQIEMDVLTEERSKVYKTIINWLNTCEINEIVRKRRKCLNEIKNSFSKALGETRRAANDVTLWDHSYMTATIMKALVACRVLDPTFEVKSKKDIKDKKPFQIFAIGWDFFGFIEQSHKIPDVVGRIKILEEIKEEIRGIVEEKYALGNSIYDDDFGIYFLIPSILSENDLEEVKRDLFKVFNDNDKTNGILLPVFHLEKQIKNEELRIGSLLTKAIENIRKKINSHKIELIEPPAWINDWESSKNVKLPKDKLVCNVCGKGFYCIDDDEKICETCKKVRNKGRQSEISQQSEIPQTVFIDEISWNPDKKQYENICLLVAKFDLNEWLDGKYVRSLFIKKPDKEENKKIEELFWYLYYEDKRNVLSSIYTILKKIISSVKQYNAEGKEGILKGIKNRLKQLHQNLKNNYEDLKVILSRSGDDEQTISRLLGLIKKFNVTNLQDVDLKEHEIEIFLGLNIENKELEGDIFIKGDKANEIVKELFDMDKPSLTPFKLLYRLSRVDPNKFYSLILQKPSSPSRLMRVWNNTKEFFENVSKLICLSVPTINECKIILEDNINNLTPNMAYILEIDRKEVCEAISLKKESKELFVITPHTNEYLTENINEIKGKEIMLKHPDSKNIVAIAKIKDIKEKGRIIRAYRTISTSPTLFMAIIPASKSFEIVKMVKEEYMKHFGKVFGKLPLHIGLIYFKRKMPIFTVLDTAKRMINKFENTNSNQLHIISEPKREGSYVSLTLSPNNAGQVDEKLKSIEYEIKIPYRLGDGKEDYYHPYLEVENSDDVIEVKINNETITQKHVIKIKKNDVIKVKEYFFDFEFLDSNVRRFDMSKERKHWLFTESENKPKPYLLWDIDNFDRLRNLIERLGLTNTQIMNLYEMLIEKIDKWEIRKPPAELLSSEDKENKKKAGTFERLADSAIKSVPLRLKAVDGESGKGKISKEDFEFLKNTILTGLFFDFVDLWHTILKFKFDKGGEKNE